jgi:hypothetical protein
MMEPLHKAINGRKFYPTQTRYVVKITDEEYALLMACSHRMDIGGIAYYLRSKSHATGEVHLARMKFGHGIAFDLRHEDDDESNRDQIGHLIQTYIKLAREYADANKLASYIDGMRVV